MAHFAKLDINNKVLEVHCINNNELLDENGNEIEIKGIEFLIQWSDGYKFWKQTSYNGKFRKNFACIGDFYDEQKNAFISPKPFDSWSLNEETCRWEAPIAMPNDGQMYSWNEANQTWDAVSG